jgi:hypothetical protein
MLSLFPPELQAVVVALEAFFTRARRSAGARVAVPVALAAALVVALLPATTGVAEASTAASKRQDVNRMLAPMKTFDRAVGRRWGALERRGVAWSATVVPCVQDTYAELRDRRKSGAMGKTESQLAEVVVMVVALTDASQHMAAPLDRELSRAQKAYRNVRVGDRILRVGARAKAREIAAMRKLGDVDTCAFATQWTQADFGLRRIPEMAPGIQWDDELGGAKAGRDVAKASRRLRTFGASRGKAEDFAMFPLIPLAAPAISEDLFPR